VSLDAFIIANDADVYGRRSGFHGQNEITENSQVEYPSPLHSLQKYATLRLVNNFDTVTALHSHLDEINLLDADRLRPSWDSYFMVGLPWYPSSQSWEMTHQFRLWLLLPP
jgi:dCMP deaminase